MVQNQTIFVQYQTKTNTISNSDIVHDFVALIVSCLYQYQTIFDYNIKQIKLQYCNNIVTLQ